MMARHNMTAVTAYFERIEGLAYKRRMRALQARDHRRSESCIAEEAIKFYVPMLEAQLMVTPPHEGTPTRRRRRAVGE